MPLDPQNHQLHATDRVKTYIYDSGELPGAIDEYSPHFYVESRIDFNDVRTGLKETIGISKALEIYSDNPDLLWTKDMIRDVDPQKIKPVVAVSARFGRLPGFVDPNFMARMETQFVQYLLRSFTVQIYRNFAANAYSFYGESPREFIRRCGDLLSGPRRRELDLLHDVFNRRLEQINQRYLHAGDSAQLDEAREISRNRDVFSRYADRIAGLFLNAETMARNSASLQHRNGMRELEERLHTLELEVQRAILKIVNSYIEKTQSVDEYILHPNLKDIHFVRSCILWMPARAA